MAEDAEMRPADEAVRLNDLTRRIIGAAITVHRELGPGLLESAYEACLWQELIDRGLEAKRQVAFPLLAGKISVRRGCRVDLLVANCVVVEVKAIVGMAPIHLAKLSACLKQAKCKVGLLINFNVPVLVHGVRRVVCGFPETTKPARPNAENGSGSGGECPPVTLPEAKM